MTTLDPDAGNTHSYTVSDNRFEVVNGELKLAAGKSLDYETESSVQLDTHHQGPRRPQLHRDLHRQGQRRQ
ncbi:MAG: hypothetical protein HC869_24485 [Rhodospirillales bacterium]|nr:hypothetical protein [Rhodospirillales bacterium]